jgi:hypothetical protein
MTVVVAVPTLANRYVPLVVLMPVMVLVKVFAVRAVPTAVWVLAARSVPLVVLISVMALVQV